MLAVTFVISCVTACGSYICVLMQLQREHKRLSAHKKRLLELSNPGDEAAEDLWRASIDRGRRRRLLDGAIGPPRLI